jgi:hypothetical protein
VNVDFERLFRSGKSGQIRFGLTIGQALAVLGTPDDVATHGNRRPVTTILKYETPVGSLQYFFEPNTEKLHGIGAYLDARGTHKSELGASFGQADLGTFSSSKEFIRDACANIDLQINEFGFPEAISHGRTLSVDDQHDNGGPEWKILIFEKLPG